MNKKHAIVYGAIAFSVALLDGVLKFAAQQWPPDTTELAWPIAFALHKNQGIVANFPLPLAVVIPITVGICGVLVYIVWTNRRCAPQISLAGWVLLCGAMSNLLDRAFHHYTTDYLIFFQRSAVNLADGLILIGAVLFAWYSKDSSRNV